MIERRSGTCCAVKYSVETLDNLSSWLSANNIPNKIDIADVHTTLLYSRVKMAELEMASSVDSVALCTTGCKFKPKEFKKFGSALVLVLDAPELVNAHRRMLDDGATHDHAEYVPHVTVSYNVDDTFDVESLNIPTFMFKPEGMYFEPLNLDWKS